MFAYALYHVVHWLLHCRVFRMAKGRRSCHVRQTLIHEGQVRLRISSRGKLFLYLVFSIFHETLVTYKQHYTHQQGNMSSESACGYAIPESYANLSELVSPAPVQNLEEKRTYRQQSLEETRSHEQDYMRCKHSVEDRHVSLDANDHQAVAATKAHRTSCTTFWTCLRYWILGR